LQRSNFLPPVNSITSSASIFVLGGLEIDHHVVLGRRLHRQLIAGTFWRSGSAIIAV
jgi:hypothetical protein